MEKLDTSKLFISMNNLSQKVDMTDKGNMAVSGFRDVIKLSLDSTLRYAKTYNQDSVDIESNKPESFIRTIKKSPEQENTPVDIPKNKNQEDILVGVPKKASLDEKINNFKFVANLYKSASRGIDGLPMIVDNVPDIRLAKCIEEFFKKLPIISDLKTSIETGLDFSKKLVVKSISHGEDGSILRHDPMAWVIREVTHQANAILSYEKVNGNTLPNEFVKECLIHFVNVLYGHLNRLFLYIAKRIM